MFKNISQTWLIKVVLILMAFYLLTLLWPTIMGVLNIIMQILLPFIIGFVIAYILVPFVNYLNSKKIHRSLAILIVSTSIFAFIVLIGFIIIPTVYGWVEDLVISYKTGLESLGDFVLINFNINIDTYINEAIIQIENAIEEFKTNFINNAPIFIPEIAAMIVSFVMQTIFSIVISLYVLGDSFNVKTKLLSFLAKINRDFPIYIKVIDTELRKYLNAYILLFFIKIIEYMLIYYALGNKNFLAMGLITGISIFIPYIGGLMASIIGIITMPPTTSTAVYIIAIIVLTIMSNVDEYFISPRVYSSSLKVSPLLILFAVFAGSTLYGFAGVIIAIPVMVVINISVLTYFKLKKEKQLKEESTS